MVSMFRSACPCTCKLELMYFQRFLPFIQLARIFDAVEGLLTLQSFMRAGGVFLFLPHYVEFCQQDYFKCILNLDSFSKTVLAVIIFNQFA